MILSFWRVHTWTKEEIEAFAYGIQDLNAEITTSAVALAAKELKFPPKLAELREFVRAERRRLAPMMRPVEDPKGRPLPLWVRRWICARYLYEKFGKERDLRRFPEQGDFGNLTMELMPEGAWTKEAESIPEDGFHEAFSRLFRT